MGAFQVISKPFLPLQQVEARASICLPLDELTVEQRQVADQPEHGLVDGQNSRLQRFIDWLVRISGSKTVFCLIQACLVAWALLAIPFSNNALWPIVISDAQAIVSYIFDTLLMRQQLAGFAAGLHHVARLRSRNASKWRMVEAIKVRHGELLAQLTEVDRTPGLEWPADPNDALPSLPMQQALFARCLTRLAQVTGHIASVGLFVSTIVLWVAFGPSTGWSNQWQLDINSATSAWMVFLFSLLAVVREEHAVHLKVTLEAIDQMDRTIERRLRTLSGDRRDHEACLIVMPKTDVVQRVINVYAHIVGGLVGLAILVVVFIVWAAIGPALHFNDNWWLLIGTYSGLIGMNDGFVLRNVQQELDDIEQAQMDTVLHEDRQLMAALQGRMETAAVPLEEPVMVSRRSIQGLSQRISYAVCHWSAHRMTVVLGALSIVGLLIGSTAMHWSLTGQLLCNVPPSIVESFFMQILITGHLDGEQKRSADLHQIYQQRRTMLTLLQRVHVPHSDEKASPISSPSSSKDGKSSSSM